MANARDETIQPDRGGRWSGAIVVLTMWSYSFISVGVVKSLGVMLPTLQVQFESETWIIGWITSMIAAMSGLIGPFVGLLGRRLGTGCVIMTCGVMLGVASILGSFTVTTLQLALAYMLLAGTSLGISCILSKEAVGHRFDENHAIAVGIARTGSSIALFVCAPLVQLFLDIYGWRGTMLLMGGIFSHMTVCGALMHLSGGLNHRTDDYQQIPLPEDSSSTRHPTIMSSLCTMLKSFVFSLDLKLLRDVHFWMAAVIYCNAKFVFDMWTIYFVSSVQSIGFSLDDAATFIAVAGVGNLIGKIAQGIIVDRGILPSWSLMGIALGVSTASYCATPWLTSYWSIMISALLILIAEAFTSCLNDVFAKKLLGVELLASAYGWMGILNTVLRFTLGFLPGLIYDNSGSYNAAFVFLGCVQASALISLLFARCKQLL